MIRLGLRLCVAGGREALTRLALIAIAVAVGVGLLLTTLASLNAVTTQNARYAWLETAYTGSNAPANGAGANDPLWWRLRADYFQGELIGRVDLAGTGPESPRPPGIAALPGAGEFYASPALSVLLRDTPAAELGSRYPGREVGVIGPGALPAPNSLIIVIGHSASELAQEADVSQVARISTTVPSSCRGGCAYGVGFDSSGMTLILSVVVAALLFPVLIFIGSATRLSAARREQRFAAMRLVGATPRQISVISTVESALAAVAGVLAGFGLFYLFRPLLAAIPFTGDPFFTSDLALTPTDVVLVALGIPVGAAVAARMALRRVTISPLGVTRRVTPQPPRAWRLIPLLAGLAELGYLAYFSDIGDNHKHSSTTQASLYLIGIFLAMGGLVVAGPWLTMIAARLIAARATRPATLIAARRLGDNPQASFRAISGLVLALFIGTCSLGIITTIVAYSGPSSTTTALTRGTLVDEFRFGAPKPVPPSVLASVSSTTGVTGVAVVHADPDADPHRYPPQALVSCAQIARVPALGHCPSATVAATIIPIFRGGVVDSTSMSGTTWPAASASTDELDRLPAESLVVATDGSAAAVERVRTVLGGSYPDTYAAQTLSEMKIESTGQLDDYRRLATVVILASLPIAGCSLAVSIAGGLAERKRPFSLLRLAGAPLGMLRRLVTLEAAAPLLVTAAVSIGAGLLAAQLFLRAQLHETLQPPGTEYYVAVAVGLLVSLAIIASTLPLIRRMTGPEVARND